ncbi:putative oxidoreductase, partial [Lachnellula suecica]
QPIVAGAFKHNTKVLRLTTPNISHIRCRDPATMSAFKQLFPGKPTFTEKDTPDQNGKVFMVTGGNSGLGYELVKILYSKGAKIYMASRSASKAKEAIQTIKTSTGPSSGAMIFLTLDLADLTSVTHAVSVFAAHESKLDVLWNNAGVAAEPAGSRTKQGYELTMGTNALAPYLFTQLLLPFLRAAAKTAPQNSVRVVFAGSPAVEGWSPRGFVDELSHPGTDWQRNYGSSKAANWLLASEFASRVSGNGIIFLCNNPGNLRTKIWDGVPVVVQYLLRITMHPPIYGAYTNLWTGLSQGITMKDRGRYAIPWGKWHPSPKEDILKALKSEKEGVTGEAGKFWEWCERETKIYA